MPEEYFAINHSMSRRTPSTMDSAGILAEVVALNGAKGTITLGTGTWRIDLATVIPANARLVVEQGAMLTKYGSGTLTINGPFEAPLAQVFSGFAAGEVLIGNKVDIVFAEWFGAIGDDSTDDAAAIQSAIDSLSGVGIVDLLAKVYLVSEAIELPAVNGTVITLRGKGNNATSGVVTRGTVIHQTGAGKHGISSISSLAGNPRITLEDFTVLGPDVFAAGSRTTTSGDGINITGPAVSRVRMRDVTISNFVGNGTVGLRIDAIENSVIESVNMWNCAKGFEIGNIDVAATRVTSANAFSKLMSHQNVEGGRINGSTGDTWVNLCVQSNETDGLTIDAGSLLNFITPWFENNNTDGAGDTYGLLLQSSADKYVGQIRFINAMINRASDSGYIVGDVSNPIRSVIFEGGYAQGGPNVTIGPNVLGVVFDRSRIAYSAPYGGVVDMPYDSSALLASSLDTLTTSSLWIGTTNATALYLGKSNAPIKIMSGYAGNLAGATPSNGATVTLDCRSSNVFMCSAGAGVSAFTVGSPTNPVNGQELTIMVTNASGGSLTTTWDSAFKMSAWVDPANGYSKTIRFFFDSAVWREISRTADFAN